MNRRPVWLPTWTDLQRVMYINAAMRWDPSIPIVPRSRDLVWNELWL